MPSRGVEMLTEEAYASKWGGGVVRNPSFKNKLA